MKFTRFLELKRSALSMCGVKEGEVANPASMNSLVLALIGDSVFTFYVRMRLLHVSSHVRVIHDIAARMVSAVMQSRAMHALESELTDTETAVARRGRNAKSTVPKSACVEEYRQATAFEALCGYLMLAEEQERLEEILDKAFTLISEEMRKEGK